MISLFLGDQRAYRMVEALSDERIPAEAKAPVVFPVTAITIANAIIKGTENVWLGVIYHGVTVTDLTLDMAVEIGTWPGELDTRHAVHEAQTTGGYIVTCEPDRYRHWVVPLILLPVV
jgi:hypothetical protein